MNAINGILNIKSKSPFNFQGLSIYQRTGVNHVDHKDHSLLPLPKQQSGMPSHLIIVLLSRSMPLI